MFWFWPCSESFCHHFSHNRLLTGMSSSCVKCEIVSIYVLHYCSVCSNRNIRSQNIWSAALSSLRFWQKREHSEFLCILWLARFIFRNMYLALQKKDECSTLFVLNIGNYNQKTLLTHGFLHNPCKYCFCFEAQYTMKWLLLKRLFVCAAHNNCASANTIRHAVNLLCMVSEQHGTLMWPF